MLSASRYHLTKVRMLHLLQELKTDSINVASLCLPPKSDKNAIQGMIETILDAKSIPEDVVQSASESPTGAMLFWGAHHRYLVLPPFPLKETRASHTCEIEPLDALLRQEFLIGLVLVRLGSYGIGVFQGEKLLSSKVGTGLVHARHRQGGSSSHRFERHRYKQMETFFTRVSHMPGNNLSHTRVGWSTYFMGELGRPFWNFANSVILCMNLIKIPSTCS
jgi:peptide subunit release factor 1 (eRF1)